MKTKMRSREDRVKSRGLGEDEEEDGQRGEKVGSKNIRI